MSKTYTYKNTSDQDVSVVGVGLVLAGSSVQSSFVIENPVLQPVETKQKASKDTGDVA